MASATEAWAVGDAGLINHTTDAGANWTEQPSGVTANLNGVWGTDTTHVWAVGDSGTILAYDGTNWTAQASTVTADLQCVRGVDASTVWAVGTSANVVKWNGTVWAQQSVPNPKNYTLNGVFAVNATNIWAVGTGGKILKGDGSAWAAQTSGTSQDLYSVWATSTTNILAVGASGTVRISANGTSWGAGPTTAATGILHGITGTDATHVWIVGDAGAIGFYNGSGNFVAQTSSTTQALNGVSAGGTSAVMAVGSRKTFDVFNGTVWAPTASLVPSVSFNGIWGPDDANVWFAGSGGVVMRYNGSAFSASATGVSGALNDIWGADSNNIWAVGANATIIKWNGTTWSAQAPPAGVTQNLTGVFGTSATDVWAVGSSGSTAGTILHFNGTSWTAMTGIPATNLTSVWAASTSAAWAVGANGTILKFGGSTWAAETSGTTQNLTEVKGSSATSVWAAGAGGTLLKRVSAWALQAGGTTTNLTALTVVDATNQWTAGGTTILKGTGSAWTPDGSTSSPTITAAWGSSANSVFLAGPNGMTFLNSPVTIPEIAVEQPAGTAIMSGENSVDIGTVAMPANATKTFTIKATGTADLTGLALSLTGTNKGDFSTSALASSTLTAGSSMTFDVTFTPSADGTRTAAVNITSNDFDESVFTIPLTGVGQVPVTFTTQPFVTKAVNPNASVTFTCVVSTTATKPLAYQWQKYNTGAMGWEDIASATSASYTILHALDADDGDYQCVVTNPVSAVATNTATLVVNQAVVIGTHPASITVGHNNNTDVNLQVVATGTEPKKYVWRKNGAAIAGAPNAATYTITNAQLANGGDYTVVVSNAVNSQTSNIATVTVVDVTPKTLYQPTTGTAIITATYTGKVAATNPFAWKKGGGSLPADFRYTFKNNVLTIASLQLTPTSDADTFTCDVTGIDGTPVTATCTLVIFSSPPEIQGVEPLAMPDAMVGDPTYHYQIPVDPDPLKSPTSFTVAGLPAGLVYNKITGLISGRPAVALTADKSYAITLTATNAKNKSVKKATLLVKALPAASVGVFTGPIVRQSTLNKNLGGKFDLTTTTTGALTGKVTLGALSYSIPASLLISDATNTNAPHATVTIKRTTGLPNLTVTFTMDLANHALTACDITDNTAHASFTAWHKRWGTVMTVPEMTDLKTYLGYYTFGIDPPIPGVPVTTPPTSPSELQPQGMGYGSFTVSSSGAATAAGKLPDGASFTCATFCGPHGEILVYQSLYTNLGSVLGTLDITQGTAGYVPTYGDNTLGGTVSWLRPQILAATNHIYRAGFGPLDCTAIGGRYFVPAAPALLLGADANLNPNARLTFTDGGITGTSTDAEGTKISPDMDVLIKKGGTVAIAAHSTTIVPDPNPRSTTLTIAQSTGIFSGKATLIDQNPAVVGTNITRSLSYFGIIFRDTDTQMRGYAYFLLARRPDVGSAQTVTTTDQLSGQVLLQPK